MSNLKLVADDPTPLERLLLDASRSEQPSDEHKARLRAALGLGAPLSGPLTAAPPEAASPVAEAASVGRSGLARSAPLAKVALGTGVLAALGALWFTQTPDSAPVDVKPSPVVQPVTPAPVPDRSPSPARGAAPEVSPLPPVEQRVVTPRARTTSSAPEADDLSEQIRLIEAARAGVAARDAKAALAAVSEYSSKFPRGSFGQEAAVLRIRAIDQSGDSARATAMAKAFIARFPKSPHVARLSPIAERGTSR